MELRAQDGSLDNLFQSSSAFSTPDLSLTTPRRSPATRPGLFGLMSAVTDARESAHENTVVLGLGHNTNPLKKLARDHGAYGVFKFEDAHHFKKGSTTWKLTANADATGFERGDRNFNTDEVHANIHVEHPLYDRLRLKSRLQGHKMRIDYHDFSRFVRSISDFIYLIDQHRAGITVILERKDARVPAADPRGNGDALRASVGPGLSLAIPGTTAGRLDLGAARSQTWARGSDEDAHQDSISAKLTTLSIRPWLQLESLEVVAERKKGKHIHSRSNAPREDRQWRAMARLKHLYATTGDPLRPSFRLDVGYAKQNSTIDNADFHQFVAALTTTFVF